MRVLDRTPRSRRDRSDRVPLTRPPRFAHLPWWHRDRPHRGAPGPVPDPAPRDHRRSSAPRSLPALAQLERRLPDVALRARPSVRAMPCASSRQGLTVDPLLPVVVPMQSRPASPHASAAPVTEQRIALVAMTTAGAAGDYVGALARAMARSVNSRALGSGEARALCSGRRGTSHPEARLTPGRRAERGKGMVLRRLDRARGRAHGSPPSPTSCSARGTRRRPAPART